MLFQIKKQPRFLYCPVTNLSQQEHLAFFHLPFLLQMHVVVGNSQKTWLIVCSNFRLQNIGSLSSRYDPVDRSTALSPSLWECKDQMLLVMYHFHERQINALLWCLWCTNEYENMSPFSDVGSCQSPTPAVNTSFMSSKNREW